MAYYRPGTQINFKRQQIKDEIAQTAFWVAIIGGFFFCLFA